MKARTSNGIKVSKFVRSSIIRHNKYGTVILLGDDFSRKSRKSRKVFTKARQLKIDNTELRVTLGVGDDLMVRAGDITKILSGPNELRLADAGKPVSQRAFELGITVENPNAKLKDECLDCSYLNPKATNAYKCHVRGSCPAIAVEAPNTACVWEEHHRYVQEATKGLKLPVGFTATWNRDLCQLQIARRGHVVAVFQIERTGSTFSHSSEVQANFTPKDKLSDSIRDAIEQYVSRMGRAKLHFVGQPWVASK